MDYGDRSSENQTITYVSANISTGKHDNLLTLIENILVLFLVVYSTETYTRILIGS